MVALYSYAQERLLEQMKFQGRLAGAKFDEDDAEKKATETPRKAIQGDSSFTLFKHPSEYAHLSPKEKQRLTEQMRGVHRQVMNKLPRQMGKG